MTGFRTDSGQYYVCGSQPYRSGMGCGPGVYVPQKHVENEVIAGLDSLIGVCADPKGFVRKVNEELRQIWASRTGFDADVATRLRSVESKIANIRQAIEDGLADANWANGRLRELISEKTKLERQPTEPPKIDIGSALAYRRDTVRLLQHGEALERKRLLRTLVEEVKLAPEQLEVQIRYRVPEFVMNRVVAGDGFEPPTFGL